MQSTVKDHKRNT